jgi:ketosteroid isomerase-like protein
VSGSLILGGAMPRDQIVRKPLRVREGTGRTVDQRLSLRFPRLTRASGMLLGKLPPSSRLRQAVLWRSVRSGLEAFNRRDFDAALAAGNYAPDFEYHPPQEFVAAGFFEPSYRGAAGYREFMSTWSDVFGADLRMEPRELIDLGDHIVLLADVPARAQASGLAFVDTFAAVWVLDGGRVTRLEGYRHHAEALQAVGLGE